MTKALANARINASDQFTVQIKDATGAVVNSTTKSTTAGANAAVTAGTGTTGVTTVVAGATYTLTETGGGAYNRSIACTNANPDSGTVLPAGRIGSLTTPPTVTPVDGDAISCTLTNATRPFVSIVASTSAGDDTFGYTVTVGGTPSAWSVTTSAGTGTILLTGTPGGQNLNITQNAAAGWTLTTSACIDGSTGKAVTLPATLASGDDVVCSFANRPTATPMTSACQTTPVTNADFNTALAPWTATGYWARANKRIADTDDRAKLSTDWLTQTVYAVAPSSAIVFDLIPADGGQGKGGNQATLQVFYGGTQYAQILTSQASAGFSATASLTGLAGAVVSPATITMGTARTVTLTLPPSGVPKGGDLQFRMGVTGTGDGTISDDVHLDEIGVRTTGICLQKQSVGGYGTFAFDSTLGSFTVTTAATANPAILDPNPGTPAKDLLVAPPGMDIAITETGPADWRPSTASCIDAASATAITVDLNGETVAIPGASVPSGTVLNCLIEDEPRSPPTLTLSVSPHSFRLAGPPGATVSLDNAITATVTTDDPVGYDLSIRALGNELLPATGTNPDRIALSDLFVRPHGQAGYAHMSLQPLPLRGSTRPAPTGDAIGIDVRVEIPWVRPDDYSATLECVAVAR